MIRLALALAAVAAAPQGPAPQRPTLDPTAPGQLTLAPVQAAPDGESTVVEELQVVAEQRGPAMWTVSRGDADVVVLGAYSPLPHALDWDQTRLQRVLKGARALYVPEGSIGLISGAGVVFTMNSLKLSGGRTLADVIGPQRLAALQPYVQRSHADFARYERLKPGVAGYQIYGDFTRAAGFSLEKPRTTVVRAAKAAGVPVRPLAKVSIAALIRTVEKLDEAQQLACFDGYLKAVDALSSHGAAAGDAWAHGRLAELRRLAAPSPDRYCLPSASGTGVIQKGVADAAASIDEALKAPGHSVALVPMEFLLPADGVLDRLKAQGAQITVPPG